MPPETMPIATNSTWWNQLFANPWIISLVSGIVISISKWAFSKFLRVKKENEYHKQQITSANMEILNILRLYLPDKKIPKNEVILRLINAISRKYNINSRELLSINDFFSELTKEVLNNQFISNENKLELCDLLNKRGEEITTSMIDEYTYTNDSKYSESINYNMMAIIPTLFMALCATLIVYISIVYKNGYSIFEYKYFYSILLFIFLYMTAIIFVMYKRRRDKLIALKRLIALQRLTALRKKGDETNTNT